MILEPEVLMDKPKKEHEDAANAQESEKQDKFDPSELIIEDKEQTSSMPPPKKQKRRGKILKTFVIWLIALSAIAAIATAGIIYFLDKESSEPASQTQTQPEEQSAEESVASELSETYDSTLLRLSFMHPSDWTVNEVDRGITVSSPQFEYATDDGETVNGSFKVYIRKGARSVDGNYLGKGFAVKPSEEISYSSPEPGQREDTYLSAFGLDEPDNFAYFILQGNIKLDEGDTLGPDFAKEPDAYLIFGGYTSEEREDDLSTNTLSLDDYDQTSQYLTAVEILKSLQLR
jgi:hypothetical protein